MAVNGQVTEVGLAVKAGGESVYFFVTVLAQTGEFDDINQVVSAFDSN